MKIKLRSDNPVLLAQEIKIAVGERSKDHHTWAEGKIEQFRAKWARGTR